jgi:hypothetical protein
MALDLRFASPAEVGLIDRDAGERVGAEQHHVPALDFGVLERKRVERSLELGLGQEQWRGDVIARPVVRQIGAGLEIGDREVGDQRQTRQQAIARAVEVRPIGGNRSQAIAEHAVKTVDEPIGGGLPGASAHESDSR